MSKLFPDIYIEALNAMNIRQCQRDFEVWKRMEEEMEQKEPLPNGYQIVKDMVLPKWHVLHNGSFININEYSDRTYIFDSEKDACAFCWRHSRGEIE